MTAEEIESAVADAGLEPLSPEQSARFAQYLALLLKWNSKLNLTAIREPSQIVRRHFLEGIQCARALPEVKTLLDFGSGAGFPGIPISILHPEIEVTLGESQAKKAAFLQEATRSLSLSARVFGGRIETMPSEMKFGAVSLRAVDKMAEACANAIQRLPLGGWLIVFLTSGTEAQIRVAAPSIAWSVPVRLGDRENAFLLLGQKTV